MIYCTAANSKTLVRMNDKTPEQYIDSWNTYWQGASDEQSKRPGVLQHPAFQTFWSMALGEFVTAHPGGRVIDIGTGDGVLIEFLSQVPGANLVNVSCVDVSQPAIDTVKKRFPDVTGIVADAKSIAVESGGYDLVTSQFGIEYAGPGAIDEAVRLLTPGGSLLFLMHIRPGELYREGTTAIDALQRTQASHLIPLARDFFATGFVAAGGGERAPYEKAGERLNPAIQALEAIVSEHGEHVAGDMMVYLHSTIQAIHQGIERYDQQATMNWLDRMETELLKHIERMESMRDSALDEAAFKKLCEQLHRHGLSIQQSSPLMMRNDELPVAWVLQATKPQ